MTVQGHMEHFSPGPEMDRQLSGALSRFGTGVTVVTAQSGTGPVGITANSFSSVSLDPPLVLWSADKTSNRFPHFSKALYMAIHVLAHTQMPVCKAFAATADGFDRADWRVGDNDLPLIKGCLARFECERYAEYDGGDHAIIVARVLRASVRQGAPLLFFGGQFGNFVATG